MNQYSFEFVLEGNLSKFGKKVISMKSKNAGTRLLNKTLDKAMMTGSKGDPVKMASIRLRYLKRKDPETAKDLFKYFNGHKKEFSPEKRKHLQKIASNLGLKNGCDIGRDAVGGVGTDTINKIAHGTGTGVKLGGQIGATTGIIAPTLATGAAVGASNLHGLDINSLQQTALRAGQATTGAISKASSYVPYIKDHPGLTTGIGAAATGIGTKTGLSLLGAVKSADKTIGKGVGKVVGGVTGGAVGGGKQLVKSAQSVRNSYIDPVSKEISLKDTLDGIKRNYKHGHRTAGLIPRKIRVQSRIAKKKLKYAANPLHWFKEEK